MAAARDSRHDGVGRLHGGVFLGLLAVRTLILVFAAVAVRSRHENIHYP
jgi:hypothetical protein